jgi:hypothetical protein
MKPVRWLSLPPSLPSSLPQMGLRLLLKTLGIAATKLHNGGNDARYTMEALLALAALGPVSPTLQV